MPTRPAVADLVPALSALHEAIAAAADVASLAGLPARIQALLRDWSAAGLDGQARARLLSGLNDRLSRRVIAVTAAAHRLPPVAWCWLALGSEGRDEQTLVSDQDNGLIFAASDDAEAAALRELFLPFARAVNGNLAACGFTLCKGEVMAGNAKWCLSLDEWQEQFIEWVRRPDPMALLHATIFFDLRPLYGDFSLADALRRQLLAMSVEADAFLRLMAINALEVDVPLGWFGDLREKGGDDGVGIDLKKFGSRLFVDAARILALAAGCPAVNTGERLRAAGRAGGLADSEIAAVDAAFGEILRLRFEQQFAAVSSGNSIHAATLNEFDRVVLKEALHQARRIQQRLKLNYVL